jgi:hypothetical protein
MRSQIGFRTFDILTHLTHDQAASQLLAERLFRSYFTPNWDDRRPRKSGSSLQRESGGSGGLWRGVQPDLLGLRSGPVDVDFSSTDVTQDSGM